MSSAEFDDSWLDGELCDPAELTAQAVGIEELATEVLANPDWEQVELHFETPFGSGYRLELWARTSRGLGNEGYRDFRDVKVLEDNSEGILLARFMMKLDKDDIEERKGRYPLESDTVELLARAEGADEEAIAFMRDAIQLHHHGYDQAVMDRVESGYASLMSRGSCNRRLGVWHTLIDGTFVGVLLSGKDGEQPWGKVDDEAEVQVRVKTGDRTVDFMRYRDGRTETFDVDPNTGRVLRSIVGEERVLQRGEEVIEFDLGDNAAKKAVVEEMERAMGMRDLSKERLDFIEGCLRRAAAERQA